MHPRGECCSGLPAKRWNPLPSRIHCSKKTHVKLQSQRAWFRVGNLELAHLNQVRISSKESCQQNSSVQCSTGLGPWKYCVEGYVMALFARRAKLQNVLCGGQVLTSRIGWIRDHKAIAGMDPGTHQYWGMCWLRVEERKLVPFTFRLSHKVNS